MGPTEIKKEDIKLREVYLEDLKSVITLYGNNLLATKHENGVGTQLTSNFGLPIGIAEKNGKVIAYSRVNIDGKGKPIFQIHTNETGGTDTVCKDLSNFSEERFAAIWGDNKEQSLLMNKPVQSAIDKLVDWLNHCS